MPVLTLAPSTLARGASALPSGEPAASITEGKAPDTGGDSREGSSTNDTQHTWTRLFQSLLTNNQAPGSAGAQKGSVSKRKTQGATSPTAALPPPLAVPLLLPAQSPVLANATGAAADWLVPNQAAPI